MKILLIEDDETITTFIKKSFNALAWLVESTNSGKEGLKMALKGKYKLLILDLNLPDLSGEEIIKKIRAKNKSLAIIILSVKADLKNKKELFALGADDYLTKPFLMEEIIFRCQAILRRPELIKSSSVKVGSLLYRPKDNIFMRQNKELYLTKKEHNLLLFLLKHRNRIVSKGEILEQVWNYQTSPNSNSVETHIALLRKKININQEPNLIHTFPGRGYKFSQSKLK